MISLDTSLTPIRRHFHSMGSFGKFPMISLRTSLTPIRRDFYSMGLFGKFPMISLRTSLTPIRRDFYSVGSFGKLHMLQLSLDPEFRMTTFLSRQLLGLLRYLLCFLHFELLRTCRNGLRMREGPQAPFVKQAALNTVPSSMLSKYVKSMFSIET